MNLIEYEAIIEAILFASGEPLEIESLAKTIEQDIKTTKSLVSNLMDKYSTEKRGIMILEIDGSYQMSTNPKYFEYIKKIYQNFQKKPLSQTLLETLAIIAYKQPITKGEIEEIRGVNADHAVNKLLEYNLIKEKGRKDTPGKPILIGTSDEFLKHFGFTSINQLPTMHENYDVLKKEAEEEIDSRIKI